MSYKIIVDSCGELTEDMKASGYFETASLEIDVAGHHIIDDETFDQAGFLKLVASSPECPKSSCPSPERYMQGYCCDADHVYAVTLSAELSGSYNSAMLGKNLYHEEHGEKDIYVFNSRSASVGETLIAMKIAECEEKGMEFQKIVDEVEAYIAKQVMGATEDGVIKQLGQARGVKKALIKMADHVVENLKNSKDKILAISHCNCPDRAEYVKEMLMAKAQFRDVVILDTAGISSMYASDGGIIVVV